MHVCVAPTTNQRTTVVRLPHTPHPAHTHTTQYVTPRRTYVRTQYGAAAATAGTTPRTTTTVVVVTDADDDDDGGVIYSSGRSGHRLKRVVRYSRHDRTGYTHL